MATSVTDLLEQALRMDAEDRALIAERLLNSLDVDVDPDVEKAWQDEVQRRVKDIEEGRVECIPWERVQAEVRRRIHDTA